MAHGFDPKTQKTIILNNTNIKYTCQRSKRAKKVRLTVDCDAGLVVTIPQFLPSKFAEKFIQQKAAWIIKTLSFLQNKAIFIPKSAGASEERKAREQARLFVSQRVEYFNQFYEFSINKIFIKSHKRKWGSCSHKKNLNFNYRVIYLPQELADYIVAHELCHLKEMNHSKKFWRLVSKTIPDHAERRKELKKYVFRAE